MTVIKGIFCIGFLFLLSLIPADLQAQKNPALAAGIDRKFSQVWNESQATRKQYVWKEKMEVIRNDEVVQVLVEEVSTDPNGRQIRRVLSNVEAPLPGTILVKQIAEGQKAKIVAFMGDLRKFLERYALTDDSTRHSFFTRADLSGPDAKGQILVAGSDVLTGGDKLKWWIDTRSYTITYATVSTVFKGVSADFSATYYLLPGLNYMAQAKIRVPSKNMVVALRFYDFEKR